MADDEKITVTATDTAIKLTDAKGNGVSYDVSKDMTGKPVMTGTVTNPDGSTNCTLTPSETTKPESVSLWAAGGTALAYKSILDIGNAVDGDAARAVLDEAKIFRKTGISGGLDIPKTDVQIERAAGSIPNLCKKQNGIE